MKKAFIIFFFILFTNLGAISDEVAPQSPQQEKKEAPVFYTAAQQERDVKVFCDNERFGLKDKEGNIVVPAKYQKIVMTGRNGWIVQIKNKYGLMDSKGNYLVKPKYRYADRIFSF